MKAMNRNPMGRSLMPGLTFIALLALAAGCTDKNGGTASPTENSTTPPASSSTATTNVFGDMKSCDVLDKAVEGQGFSPGSVDKVGGDNGCVTTKSQFGTIGVHLQPGQSIDNTNSDPSKVHDGTVNGRKSVEIQNGVSSRGDCAIMIEVTKTSRAFVIAALSTGTTDEACAFVYDVAKKVEPQLPKGN
jgi:uncharacterized protein DUF3558